MHVGVYCFLYAEILCFDCMDALLKVVGTIARNTAKEGLLMG